MSADEGYLDVSEWGWDNVEDMIVKLREVIKKKTGYEKRTI